VRNDNFQLYYVQRLNAEERNIPSLIQQGLVSEFLSRLGIAWRVVSQRDR